MSRAIALDALPEWLAGEISGPTTGVAMLAGHFALFSAGASASDLLDGAAPPVAGAREMLDFTRLTWRAACTALAATKSDCRLVTLVDDVQFIRPQLNDRGLSERLAAELAAAYLVETPELPGFHTRELAAAGLANHLVLRATDAQWIFSERQLRIDSVRHLRNELHSTAGPRMPLSANDDGSTVSVTLADGGDYCLVHSGRTSCVGGYIELLSRLHNAGVRKLIAMVPMRCLGQIALGTSVAQELFGLERFSVVNVAVPDPSVGLPAHVVPHQR